MKTNKLARILLLFLCTINFISCNKDETEPLSLHEMDSNTIYLTYGTKGGVTIIGGDRTYSFTCESPIVKGEMTHSNFILFEPLGIGETTCLIQDNSGNTYTLNIHTDYYTERIPIYKTDAFISGENLSEQQQTTLKEKALTTIPVKAGGGYLFVYTDKIDLNSSEPNLNKTKGIVYIYPEKFGENPINAVFERTIILKKEDNLFVNYEYKLQSKDDNWQYISYAVPVSKTSVNTEPKEEYILSEDLKTKFASDYTEANAANTRQYIKRY